MNMIHIDDELNTFILEKKQEYGELKIKNDEIEYEFEIRLTKNKNLTKELYTRIYNECFKKYEKSLIQQQTDVYTYQSFNSIVYRKIVEKDKPVIFQQKNNKENKDRLYESYQLRFSFSKEKKIDKPKGENKLMLIRQRKRCEFIRDGYKYVFTKINTKNNIDDKGTISYEIEIEFEMNKLNQQKVSESLQLFLDLQLFKNYSHIDSDNCKKIISFLKTHIKPQKPINIKNDNKVLQHLNYNEYQVTNKLDGERFLLYFYNNLLYAIQNDCLVGIVDINHNYISISECLIDCEYFKGKYYIFDAYLKNSKTIYELSLTERLINCQQIASTNKELFVLKKFSKHLLTCTEELLTTLNKDDNDGLIYTPENPNLRLPIYKWKFPEKMSIDFRVKKDEDEDKKGLTIYDLYVCNKNKETIFKEYFYKSDKPLKNEGIYEFVYNKEKNEFELLRERLDKVKPNFITVADNVFEDMIKPIKSYDLVNMFKPLLHFRKHHNNVKRDLIKKYCNNKIILDLGIGQGGDLFKYKDQNVQKIIGIEPDDNNYKECLKRIDENKYDYFTHIIKAKAQETGKIITEVEKDTNKKGVDIVSSFFSLSFFFSNEKDINDLVQTISLSLKEDGYFIGTTIDGNKTKTILESEPNHILTYKGGFLRLNDNNSVTIKIEGGIVREQNESLVNFNLLVSKLKEVGIQCKNYSPFPRFINPLNIENEQETKLNSLYYCFIFQKENMMAYINNLCDKNTISDMLTLSQDRCIESLRKVISKNKKYELISIDPSCLYHYLYQFYMVKKWINTIQSSHFIKYYSIVGDRIHKMILKQHIPDNTIKLLEYKNKEDYVEIKKQLMDTLLLLKKNNINYGELKELLVYKTKNGSIKLLYHNYSKISDIQYSQTDIKDSEILFTHLNQTN